MENLIGFILSHHLKAFNHCPMRATRLHRFPLLILDNLVSLVEHISHNQFRLKLSFNISFTSFIPDLNKMN